MFPSQLFREDQRISLLVFDRRGAYLGICNLHISVCVYIYLILTFGQWQRLHKRSQRYNHLEIVKWKHWQPCFLPDKLNSSWLDIILGVIGGNGEGLEPFLQFSVLYSNRWPPFTHSATWFVTTTEMLFVCRRCLEECPQLRRPAPCRPPLLSLTTSCKVTAGIFSSTPKSKLSLYSPQLLNLNCLLTAKMQWQCIT